MKELGGIPGVVSPIPEITTLKYNKDIDFIFIACDGIFDALTNDEVNDVVWETVRSFKEKVNKGEEMMREGLLKECLSECVNNVLKKSMIEGSEDNVTIILVVLSDLLDVEN